MLTKEQARELVFAELTRPRKHRYASDPADLVIVDDKTIERPWGWVFFYNSDRYLRTHDIRFALGGNAPYIVNRHTGELRSTGTAHAVEHYVEAYERELDSGDRRPYRAIVSNKDRSHPGERVMVMAVSLEDARRRLEAEHGEGTVFDLHNEDDANRPR